VYGEAGSRRRKTMKVLVFGGTSEGRILSTALAKAGIHVTLSVATEFGRDAASDKSLVILAGRLSEEKMIDLMTRGGFDCAVDATHPYAVLGTKNIRSACVAAGLKYYRIKRPESDSFPGITYVPDMATAARVVDKNSENVLLTVGSKELEQFTGIDNYKTRVFVRIIPMQESLKKALDLGFSGSNIICMQGPFDRDMNLATLKKTNAKFLVTKESGDAGGFEAKVTAALLLGCEVIVIARPGQEDGFELEELFDEFSIGSFRLHEGGKNKPIQEKKSFFPLFIDMNGRKALVIGGGIIAERRVKRLLAFGADVTVISPVASGYIRFAASQGELRYFERKYQNGDITDLKPALVIAATDGRQANREAMREASALDIPVSVADRREECTCFFPAIAENEAYTAGIVSKNGDHTGLRQTAGRIRELLGT